MDPFVGEIRLFAGNFAPMNWAFCDGSLLPIAEFEVLFNLIGTTYGGDGQSTFALPDLRGRVPIHQGQGPGLSNRTIGQTGGVEAVSVGPQQMPPHSHALTAEDRKVQEEEINSFLDEVVKNSGAESGINDKGTVRKRRGAGKTGVWHGRQNHQHRENLVTKAQRLEGTST